MMLPGAADELKVNHPLEVGAWNASLITGEVPSCTCQQQPTAVAALYMWTWFHGAAWAMDDRKRSGAAGSESTRVIGMTASG
jgi:hypothetical protein